MSINPTGSSYISNTEILQWMEEKTSGIYEKMRGSMDIANNRASAEDALGDVNAKLLAAKNNGGDPTAVREAVNEALEKYKDIPEVKNLLQPMADELNKANKDSSKALVAATLKLRSLEALLPHATGSDAISLQLQISGARYEVETSKPPPLSNEKIDSYTTDIKNKVDALGKQDQLGLIDLQELNSQVNQAKQTASALMDASSKSANSIISHIC